MAKKHRNELPLAMASEVVGWLAPGAGIVSRKAMDAVSSEWSRNFSKCLRAAEHVSGMTREELSDLLENQPRAVPLYLRLLWAAGMNGHDETMRAIGAVFGRAASALKNGDDDVLAEAELALRAMDDLTELHFRVLAALEQGEIKRGPDGKPQSYGDFVPDHIATITGISADQVHQCALNLAGAGLATTVNLLDGLTGYPITDLGRAVGQAARAVSP